MLQICHFSFFMICVSELTILMLSQVVLLHPIGSELIGRHSRESGAMQRLHAKQ